MDQIRELLKDLDSQGLTRVASSRAAAIDFSSNDYLGLANDPQVRAQLIQALASGIPLGATGSRLLRGTSTYHEQTEDYLAKTFNMGSALLFGSGYAANVGLLSTLAGPGTVVFSDELNHASIIDGIRLCKAQRHRYKNNDMDDLERCLKAASGARFRLIATDGVFSMDGYLANLPAICDLADKYDAMVMVDDSHAVGFMGKSGGGTPDHFGVRHRIDIITGTLGKALGGASGGYTSGRREIIEYLRQRSRPYLFSNTLAPVITATAIATLDLLEKDGAALREKLRNNSTHFRDGMTRAGFDLLAGQHPIIPVMLYDAKLASQVAEEMLKRGIYVIGFSYPVVPKDKARIRTQMSSAHEISHINKVIDSFIDVKYHLKF